MRAATVGRQNNSAKFPEEHRRPVRPTPVDALTARRLNLTPPLDRNRIEAAQMAALRRTVVHAQANSPWYRQRLDIHARDLRGREDLSRLPLLSAGELAAHADELLCVSRGDVARVMTLHTSGSTGAPKRIFFTRADLEDTLEFFREGMAALAGGRDKVLVLLPFDRPDSTGDLLIRALAGSGASASGYWPPDSDMAECVLKNGFSCVVGLPQHLLALSYGLPRGAVRTMLLCSDYAPSALRERMENICGCETFVHYGATETGLGGGVECAAHDGCHMREADLLVEIVEPESGRPLPDGAEGEVVVTTLNRQAMPLIRYRTGDTARLTRTVCRCGGATARIYGIRGRRNLVRLDGGTLDSQTLDDALFALEGVLDYRAMLLGADGGDTLDIEMLARTEASTTECLRTLTGIPALAPMAARGRLRVSSIAAFSPSHTMKRVIADRRGRKS